MVLSGNGRCFRHFLLCFQIEIIFFEFHSVFIFILMRSVPCYLLKMTVWLERRKNQPTVLACSVLFVPLLCFSYCQLHQNRSLRICDGVLLDLRSRYCCLFLQIVILQKYICRFHDAWSSFAFYSPGYCPGTSDIVGS